MKTFVKILLLFITLSLCAGLLFQPSSRAGTWPQTDAGGQKSESVASGQAARVTKLFDKKCARCHGADGRGKTIIGEMLGAPDFMDEKWKVEKSESQFVHSITNGKGEMPAFGKKLSKREISSLADYVRGLGKADR